MLLLSAEVGSSAFTSLRGLAARKLPEVEALIARAQVMRDWLITATRVLLHQPGRLCAVRCRAGGGTERRAAGEVGKSATKNPTERGFP